MKIGYHFWGFLGPGVADTSDDGRSHRAVLVDALARAGHEVVLLQMHRDLVQARDDLGGAYTFDVGFPDIDGLVLEWRRPVPGRNTSPCGRPGHSCDLHRQQELLARYTVPGVPTVVWDRDLWLPADDAVRALPNVTVAESALRPRAGASRLFFPVAEEVLDAADPEELVRRARPLPLLLVGDEDERGDGFDRYFAPAAARWPHRVVGRWDAAGHRSGLDFAGRLPFAHIAALYDRALSALLLATPWHDAAGHVSPRLPEAVLAGCLPMTPAARHDAETLTPAALHARDGAEVARILEDLVRIAGTPDHVLLLADCLKRLDLFRARDQVAAIEAMLSRAVCGMGAG
ncbi:MAG: hypothetical protein HOW97_17500 [Catenulispora sp.]|nr:hypothetical protein [Catenulispora sp.]